MLPSESQKPPPIRNDLEIVPTYYRGQLSYIAKDPVALSYYRLGEIEYIVLKCFQEGKGVEETQRAVKEKTGAEVAVREVYKFVEQLKRSDLLKSKGMADVRRLATQKKLRKRRKVKQFISNYLFVTIPVWDPDRILERLLPYFRVFLNRYFFVGWLLLSGAAFWIMADNFSVLVADAFSLLSGWNLVILSAVIFSVKLFHEMGHALTCKHYGGEVHAIGPAFLVFQPCMFTDTSDAWLLPSKWDRINVTAAGIIVEIMLASVAAVAWISSEPGMLKQIAYTTMVACSVSTVLFNANPLLRFDGYYILSDLLEIPNMRIKTSQYLGYLFDRYVLGIRKQPPRMQEADRKVYLLYGISRFFYRMFIVLTIGLVLYSLFEPLGVFMWISSIYGMVLAPAWRRGKELTRQYRFGTVRIRYVIVLVAAFVVLTGVWFLPIDYTVQAPCVVVPAEMEVVRAAVTGRIDGIHVQEGDRVAAGQLLVRMSNPELALLAEKTREEIKEADARMRSVLAEDAADYNMQRRQKRKLTEELAELERKILTLEVRAPIAGVVVRLHRQEVRASTSRHDFVQFPEEGPATDIDQLKGATVAAGTGLLGIAANDRLLVEAFAYEHDVSSLSPGLEMVCMLRGSPATLCESRVRAIIPVDVKTIANVGITLADVGYIPVKPAADGTSEPLVTLYVVSSRFHEPGPGLRLGQTGKAKITYGSGPVGRFLFKRIVRALRLRLQEI